MEQLKDPKKILFYALIALIIIVGMIVVALKGFNVELTYSANKRIILSIGQDVQLEKIQEKADEVFGKGNSVVQIVEVFKDAVQITAKDITEEQKGNLVEKVNELYPQEVTEGEEAKTLINSSDVKIESNENARLRDFLKPYVIPGLVVTVIILAYYAILYRKLGIIKVIVESLLVIILAQSTLLSILAIVRFPMGRLATPLMLLVYVSSLIYISGRLIKAAKLK